MFRSRTAGLAVIRGTFRDFFRDECLQMAAALSFYTLWALPPLMIILVAAAGKVFEPDVVKGEIGAQIARLAGPNAAEQIQSVVENADVPEGGRWGTIVGIGALLFGATGMLVQLQIALNRAWGVEDKRGAIKDFLIKRLISLAMLLVITFLLLVSLALNTMLAAVGDRLRDYASGGFSQTAITAGHFVISFAFLTLLFASMLKFLPDAHIPWRDVWLGAGLTAVLFAAGKFALGFYLGTMDVGSAYGAAGSLVFVLIWIYFAGGIFLLGAEFTQNWAKEKHEHIEPEEGAVPVDQEKPTADA